METTRITGREAKRGAKVNNSNSATRAGKGKTMAKRNNSTTDNGPREDESYGEYKDRIAREKAAAKTPAKPEKAAKTPKSKGKSKSKAPKKAEKAPEAPKAAPKAAPAPIIDPLDRFRAGRKVAEAPVADAARIANILSSVLAKVGLADAEKAARKIAAHLTAPDASKRLIGGEVFRTVHERGEYIGLDGQGVNREKYFDVEGVNPYLGGATRYSPNGIRKNGGETAPIIRVLAEADTVTIRS